MSRDLNPPNPSAGDRVHTLAKAGLSSIPLFGSAAAELFAMVIAPPLERRRDKWMNDVADAILELQNRGISIDDLKDNDTFVDTVLQASQTALRTSSAEKREALRNAILNAGLTHAPDESLQQMFLRWIDEFTPVHIRVLRLFHDPVRWFQSIGSKPPELYMGTLSNVLEDGVPELRGQRAIYDQVWSDLNQRGLVNTNSLHTMMTGQGSLVRRTTELGSRFIQFIEEPK